MTTKLKPSEHQFLKSRKREEQAYTFKYVFYGEILNENCKSSTVYQQRFIGNLHRKGSSQTLSLKST